MSNKYINSILEKDGSANLIDNFISNLSDGQFSSSKDLVSQVRSQTKVQSARIDKVTELSETNMQLLEEDLKLLDKTLRIYNVAGIFGIASGVLGTVLLSIKLKKHYDMRRRR